MSFYSLSGSGTEYPSSQVCVVIDGGVLAQLPSSNYGQWFATFNGVDTFNFFAGNEWKTQSDCVSLGLTRTFSTTTLSGKSEGDLVLAPIGASNSNIWVAQIITGTP